MSALDQLEDDPEFEEFKHHLLKLFGHADNPNEAAETLANEDFEEGAQSLGMSEAEASEKFAAIQEHGQEIARRNPELMAQLVAEMEDKDDTGDGDSGN